MGDVELLLGRAKPPLKCDFGKDYICFQVCCECSVLKSNLSASFAILPRGFFMSINAKISILKTNDDGNHVVIVKFEDGRAIFFCDKFKSMDLADYIASKAPWESLEKSSVGLKAKIANEFLDLAIGKVYPIEPKRKGLIINAKAWGALKENKITNLSHMKKRGSINLDQAAFLERRAECKKFLAHDGQVISGRIVKGHCRQTMFWHETK